MTVIKLSEIVDALEMQSETMLCYFNKKTGEIVPINEEEMVAAENGELDAPEWQEEDIKAVREVLETDDYVALPSGFDINEYEMMEKFCLSVKDKKIADDLFGVIKGRGAFRRFKDKICEQGLEQDWYKHKDHAYREIAKEWCESNGIEFMEY